MNVELIVGSHSLTLKVVAHDGLGLAPLHRLVERGPMQHGQTDVGYRLDPRVFSLVALLEGTDRQDLYTKRSSLQTFLSPGAALSLLFTLDDGSKRQIDCKALDAPLPHDARTAYAAQLVALRFVAADPTLYDPVGRMVAFALAGGGSGTAVPLAVPFTVGASTMDQVVPIQYTGNVLALPWRIRIGGPITSPVIRNLSTGEKLDFTAYTIGNSDYYDIDCRYGYKTVTDKAGANKIAELSTDSDLATFHLAPHPEADEGRNDIMVTGTAVDGDTEIYLNYYPRWLGI